MMRVIMCLPISTSKFIELSRSIFSLCLLTVLLISSLALPCFADELEVHFIDIGQGDAALIKSPSGKLILLDSGPSKSWPALSGYLDHIGVKRIDLLINSHPHADHIGNASRVIEHYQVKMVLDPGFAHPIRAYRNLLETIERRKLPLKLARRGRKIEIGGGAFIHLLAPEDPFLQGTRSDPNSNSVIFRLSYHDQSALFTGDAEEETEQRIMGDPRLLRADLLKVAHHGSRHASGRAFLGAVKPKHAVVSCSATNRYGHPAPETLEGLQRVGATTWVTAQQGTIVAKTDGKTWRISASTSSQIKTPQAPPPSAISKKPIPELPSAGSSTQMTQADSQTSGRVNINTASESELKTLPRIGPTLARRIIEARKTSPFTSAEELRRVKGIGAKTAERLEPLITF